MKSLSPVWLFATPWTVAFQAPPSMGFSRQKCWSGLPFPSPGDLPDPGIEPGSPALQADALLSEPPGNYTLKEMSWGYSESSKRRTDLWKHRKLYSPESCSGLGSWRNNPRTKKEEWKDEGARNTERGAETENGRLNRKWKEGEILYYWMMNEEKNNIFC